MTVSPPQNYKHYNRFVIQGRYCGFTDDQIDFMWDWITLAVEDKKVFTHKDNYQQHDQTTKN